MTVATFLNFAMVMCIYPSKISISSLHILLYLPANFQDLVEYNMFPHLAFAICLGRTSSTNRAATPEAGRVISLPGLFG